MPFMSSIRLDGLLSFAAGSEAIPLTPLNVMIGPNGSGKSNLIEAIELLHATPSAFASAIRQGGGASEWLWKGDGGNGSATIEATLSGSPAPRDLRYRLAFTSADYRTEVTDEVIEETTKGQQSAHDVVFYYRYLSGKPVLNVRAKQDATGNKKFIIRSLEKQSLIPDESVLSQRKDPDEYPELTWVGQQFGRIQTFREWSFGRHATVRQSQRTDLPANALLPNAHNLALLLNQLEHANAAAEFNRLLTRFLPRYIRFTTLVQGGSIQFFLHERGLTQPIPATRLSDGTIRFIAMLVLLLSPTPPPLLCMEEPELGLHPDSHAILAELMVEASKKAQLIVTTHSETLVSALTDEAESVLVCEHNGGTRMRRIESEKLKFWLDKYRLGEIGHIGELGGNP